jgi:hypothetical protein
MNYRMLLNIGFVVTLGVTGQAASRSSASYKIPTDTVDAAGRRAASANYANDGSLGGFGGISSVPAPPKLVKHGYVGQLYEVTSLAVAGNPAPVNEGTTSQLSATAVADDGSKLNVAPASLTWTVLSGPIASISPGGLASAQNVYQDTVASIQARFLGASGTLSLTVANVGHDDYGSYAGDGLDDHWQVQYFGENNPNAGPAIDPDGDGQNNRYEFTVGTLPLDNQSYFRFRIERVPNRPTYKNLIFSPRWPDRTYTVQYNLDLIPMFEDLKDIAISDVGPERTVTDLNAIEPNKFYRVQVTKP